MTEAILDKRLAHIHAGSKPNKTDKIRVLIESYRHEWQWSEVDMARAMMLVWPDYRKTARLRRPQCPSAERDKAAEHDWDNIHSIAEALRKADAADAAAAAETCRRRDAARGKKRRSTP